MLRYTSYLLVAAIGMWIWITPALGITAERSQTCKDLLFLVEQSRTQFTAIRIAPEGDAAQSTNFNLPKADTCSLRDDVEKTSYRCVWRHDFDDPSANTQFEQMLADVRNCIGDTSSEHQDVPVNHPDSFTSTYFDFGHGIVSVGLKKKRALMATLISVRFDGAKSAPGVAPD